MSRDKGHFPRETIQVRNVAICGDNEKKSMNIRIEL